MSGMAITTPSVSAPKLPHRLSPRAQRAKKPGLNVFRALEDDSEDENSDTMEKDDNDDEEQQGLSHLHHQYSPKISPGLAGTSPRWEKVQSRRPPKMQLEEGVPQPWGESFPIQKRSSAQSLASDDLGDVSHLSSMAVDTKGRRETRRSQHGSKANRFKAMKQRLDSMAKRDEQRQEAKSRNRQKQYEETGAWPEDEEGW